jgi:hypothetical protein
MCFQLSTWVLALGLFVVIAGATALGLWIGRSVRHDADSLREPFGVLQATALGFMGLILAFGLSLAVQRYEGPACGRRGRGQRHRHHLSAGADAP